jgi:hypothetical protein
VQEQLGAASVPLVTVGFSPPEALGPLADRLGLDGRMLSDPDRVLYRAVGLRRAAVRQVYSPGTMLHYAGALLRGRTLHRPVEDTRQMGGDALAVDGTIVRRWRPSTPDDRADATVIARAAVMR